MIYDVFTYNGESAMLRLHLAIMSPYVDKFVIVEADKTFTGGKKPMHFFRGEQYVREWWNKIEYYQMTEWDDVSLWRMAINSPNTQGAEHWAREFYIKESIQKALADLKLKDTDTVLIGDVDEILDPTVDFQTNSPVKARLRVYSYWLNNRSNEQFWGTLIAKYGDIKGKCLNHLRSDTSLYSKGDPLGWHFTNMMSLDKLRDKLNDSYTADSYNTGAVQRELAVRYKEGQDYLGRSFTFHISEDEWPQYLKDNKHKFKNLIRDITT